MRWLLIALLVSVGGLLLAAAGVIRHIRMHRKKLQRTAPHMDAVAARQADRTDLESES